MRRQGLGIREHIVYRQVTFNGLFLELSGGCMSVCYTINT